jgi:uncharacterized protein
MGNEISQKPFIKKLKTMKDNYRYDVNSNELVRVNQVISDIIEDIRESNPQPIIDKFKHKYRSKDILRYYESLKRADNEHNYFSNHRPEIFSGFKSENDIKYVLDSNLNQIILELTARCNHRCKYCAFSGRYPYKRKHEKRDMTFDTVKKAVEYFAARSVKGYQEEKSAAITFYGGEPVIRFDLIKGILELTKKKGVFKKYRFSLTTNGTLLTDEVIAYFVKNKVSINISLDGPKGYHDRYRVFSNGRGTFDVILSNLKRIKRYSSGYFENDISFNVVISPPYDMDAVINFFYKKKFFEPFQDKTRINFVDAYETTFFRDFNLEKDKENLKNELERLLNRYRRALINETHEKLTIEKQLFLEDFHTIACRPKEPLGQKYPPLGSCTPGQRRLFVNTAGEFFMCERVGSNYEIGNVDDGFNYKRIYDFYQRYDNFFKDCKYCWALRLCKKCFNNIRKGPAFDEQRKKKMCSNMLKKIEKNLIIFCEVVEKKPDAFKFLDEITVY